MLYTPRVNRKKPSKQKLPTNKPRTTLGDTVKTCLVTSQCEPVSEGTLSPDPCFLNTVRKQMADTPN